MVSILRKAHGSAKGVLLVAERPPIDELTSLNEADTARGLALRAQGGRPFERGNKAARNRKPALASLGVPIDAADPRYKAAMSKARSYVTRRARELAVMHGGTLGVGPSAMLAVAGRALAASAVLYELASVKLNPTLFRQAAQLGDSARQAELTAVGLAEREAQSRPKPDPYEAWRQECLKNEAEGIAEQEELDRAALAEMQAAAAATTTTITDASDTKEAP